MSTQDSTAPSATAPQATTQPAGTPPVTRADVLARAKFWFNRHVPYSQQRTYPDPQGKRYPTDGPGFASMALKLPGSKNARQLAAPGFADPIAKNDLRPGDLIISTKDNHVLVFIGWASTGKGSYWAYEQTTPAIKHHILPYPYYHRNPGYLPYRPKHIT
ncbi:hypothetical protein ACIQWN_36820 [Streptomyces vinaceus]|uniref:hypothetical protein n=1 Tax=Streptomyces vinaceus TaxID=1960 RepID=UPI0038026CB0